VDMRTNVEERRRRPRVVGTRQLLRTCVGVAALGALCVPQVVGQDDRAIQAKDKPVEVSHPQRRWAFLVGINDYVSHPRLKYCRQDCGALRQTLVRHGRFEPGNIVMLTDDAAERRDQPTFGQIYARLPQVLAVAEPGDLVLVYLSGHGAQFEGAETKRGYFIPLDGAGRQTCIPVSWVTEQLEACKARQKVLILDACRNDVVDAGKATRSLAGSVLGEAQGKSFVTLFSCDAGQRSSEYDRGPNGVYTHFLLEALTGRADKDRDGKIDLYEAHLYARNRTQQWGVQKGVLQSPVLKGQIADPIVLAYAEARADMPPLTDLAAPPRTDDAGEARFRAALEHAREALRELEKSQ